MTITSCRRRPAAAPRSRGRRGREGKGDAELADVRGRDLVERGKTCRAVFLPGIVQLPSSAGAKSGRRRAVRARCPLPIDRLRRAGGGALLQDEQCRASAPARHLRPGLRLLLAAMGPTCRDARGRQAPCGGSNGGVSALVPNAYRNPHFKDVPAPQRRRGAGVDGGAMYRSDLNTRDKGGAIAAVVGNPRGAAVRVSAPVGEDRPRPSRRSALQAVRHQRAANRHLRPRRRRKNSSRKPKEKEGGSAPKNIKSEATPVVAPKPKIETPPVQQDRRRPKRRARERAPTQGASDVRGPGTGAGGVGTGTGSGAGGSGTGGGGDGGVAEPPHLAHAGASRPRLPARPARAMAAAARTFSCALRVDAAGYVSECIVDRGTGVAAIDSSDLQPRPRPASASARRSIDSGQAVAGWVGYGNQPPR